MNSKKLGLFAAAAIAVLAGQANANDAHKGKGKEAGVCANACGGKHSNTAGCAGKVKALDASKKEVTTKEACEKVADAKWVTKAEFDKSKAQ